MRTIKEVVEDIKNGAWGTDIEYYSEQEKLEQLCDEILEISKANETVKDDLISRSALLEEIKSLRVTVMGLRAGKGILAEYANQYKDTLLRVIEEQPTVCNDGWILCSERLPEPYTSILVCEENGEIHLCRYHNECHRYFYDGSDWDIKESEVVAWQPLPPKFEPKGE